MTIHRDFFQVVECDACGMVQTVPLEGDGLFCCCRCATFLGRFGGRLDLDRPLALAVAGLICFVLANSFPIISMSMSGNSRSVTLLGGVIELFLGGYELLSGLVLWTTIWAPLLFLIGFVYVLLPMRLDWAWPGRKRIFRLVLFFSRWGMLEVYLLGILVAYVKLADLALVAPGLGLYGFVGLIFVVAGVMAVLDVHGVWKRLGGQEKKLNDGASMCSCLVCHWLGNPSSVPGSPHCPRCGSVLTHRKPNTLQRSMALTLTAFILYIPANLLPVMTVIHFGRGEPNTILSGVIALIKEGMWPLALVVFVASIVVPLLKLIALTFLLVSVRIKSRWRLKDRTLLYRIIESVGRWSMVDIFVISLMVALVDFGAVATIEAGPGATFFGAVVVITLLAAESFDPRLIWDS
ncbi:MAG: paraquat-inducible protein A [Magnetococcus sp. DMHC-6]